jgi:hypothetical protein
MPTSNPRVQVTLSPSLDALVASLAKHQRLSKSQVLRELLETAEPVLRRTVALMEAASKATTEMRTAFQRSLVGAESQAERTSADLLARLDSARADLVAMAEEVRGRRPARSASRMAPAGAQRRLDPPSSNRGVKSRRGAGK